MTADQKYSEESSSFVNSRTNETSMSIISAVRDFYKTAEFYFPPNVNQRMFRIRLFDNSVITIKDIIRHGRDLRPHLIRYAPKDVYFSTSRWLSPSTLRGKPNRGQPQYKVKDNCFLGSEFYIDIDRRDPLKTDSDMFNMSMKIYKFLKKHCFEKILVFNTGNGYHLWVLDFEDVLIKKEFEHPFDREYYYSKQKRKLVNLMKKKNLIFDEQVSLDTRRIIRLPGSLHGGTMKPMKLLGRIRRDFFDPGVLFDIHTPPIISCEPSGDDNTLTIGEEADRKLGTNRSGTEEPASHFNK